LFLEKYEGMNSKKVQIYNLTNQTELREMDELLSQEKMIVASTKDFLISYQTYFQLR